MNNYFLLSTICFVCACTHPDKNTGVGNAKTESVDESFNQFKPRFMEAFWEMNPAAATNSGYHKYDNIQIIPDESYRQKQKSFCNRFLDSLKNFDLSGLNSRNKTDYYLIENELKSSVFSIDELKQFEWDPSAYNLGGIFFEIIKYKGHDLQTRLKNIGERLKAVPAFYEAAKKNIKSPTVEHTDLAIKQNKGSLGVFETTLIDSLKTLLLTQEEKSEITSGITTAVLAINNYVKWLEQDVKPALGNGQARSFRIGKELFNKKFAFDIQSGFTADEIYGKAIERKTGLHTEMYKLTEQLWSKYFSGKMLPKDTLAAIRQMIDRLSLNHAHRDSFMFAINKQIPELTSFINDKQLLYLDPQKPLVVRETPMYMRGVAGASISSPGPYDADAETFYNVTPLNDYTAASAESYLREYNEYVLQILNIHEAIPGHYAQLVYSNKSPSIIKSIFGNGAMVEGWAVYTERMMLEEGYKNSPEMWLLYYKWNLRTVCNTILDYSVHVLGMTEKDALDLLINQAFQQEAEAKGKWKRATLTQVQLCSYFTGFYEIYNLRDEMKQKSGAQFNLKKFHEEFLSYGSAPVRYIRELMLNP